MMTVKAARQKILQAHQPLGSEKVSPEKGLGRVLFESVTAKTALPAWDNSAMDGFVLHAAHTAQAAESKPVRIPIRGLALAGDALQKLKGRTAFRIMTGAVIPAGGDTVLPAEDACIENDCLVFTQPVVKGRHVRRRGEEIRQGALLSIQNQSVTPGTVAFLASAGVDQVKIFSVPQVAVIVTGSELVRPGEKLKSGQIYESNSAMLIAALAALKIKPVLVKIVRDSRAVIRHTLKDALKNSDVVLLSGGVSVGDYDFSKSVLAELKVKTIFWKVAQKPGKPIYFGMRGKQSVFGLPGNPASAFVCFYEYVYPALRSLTGFKNPFLKTKICITDTPIRRDSSKTLFLKGRAEGDRVRVLPNQGSHMVSSLHEANALIVVEPGKHLICAGDRVAVDLLPLGE